MKNKKILNIKFFAKRRKLKLFLIGLLFFGILGLFVANHYIKKHGYSNLWDFVKTYWSNKSLSANAKYETLEIILEPDDYEKLKSIREKALKRGVLIDEGDSYVDAKLKHNGKKIKAKLRLKGHMTDHLQDKKWSFRIKTKKGDAFMGMKIFSVQHPGTRNYAYEWIYHQMMKQEDIIALQYDFIKVKVNNEDWGIYAIEEHFAQQLIDRNERPAGPILRFNPDMYWAWRIAENEKQIVNMENASMQSANIEPYDDENVYADSNLLNASQEGLILIEKFRRRELSTSEVFDIDKLAKFHAIIDLVGGHHSLDWSDVKYYYNSITRKMEPVAYESFSVQPADLICGAYRFTDSAWVNFDDLHNSIFSDPAFFKKYIIELKRIASKKWIDKFLKVNKKNLENKLAIVYKEFPYKNFDSKPYYQNIELIQKQLNPSRGLHAYVNEVGSDNLSIAIAGIDALPFKANYLEIENKKYKLPELYVPCKPRNTPINYKIVKIKISPQEIKKINSSTKLKLAYSIPGSETVKEIMVVPTQLLNNEQGFKVQHELIPTDFTKIDFVTIDNKMKTLKFNPGIHELRQPLVIDKGYKVLIGPGTTINMLNASFIFSYSPIIVDGDEEKPVKFISTDGTGAGFILVSTGKESVISHGFFSNLGDKSQKNGKAAALIAYESNLKLNNCTFSNNRTNDLVCFRNKINIRMCTFDGAVEDALNINYAALNMSGTLISNTGNDGLETVGSMVIIRDCKFEHVLASACLARSKAEVTIVGSTINRAKTGLNALDASKIYSNTCEIRRCTTAMKASKKGDVFGPSAISVKKLKQEKNKLIRDVEKNSSIVIEE